MRNDKEKVTGSQAKPVLDALLPRLDGGIGRTDTLHFPAVSPFTSP